MTITFAGKVCAVVLCMNAYLLLIRLKRQFNNKNLMKGISYYITPISSCSAGYCEKPSHGCMIDSHLAWKHMIPKYI